MGTNYYAIKNVCSCCGRQDTEHIGKFSGGWSFSFQGSEIIRDFDSWFENLKDAEHLEDEYGQVVTVSELMHLIDGARHDKNHAKSVGNGSQDNWIDQYGNSFTGSWFS